MSSARMALNNDFEGRQKEVVMFQCGVLFKRMHGGTEEYHEKPLSEKTVSGPSFQPGTS